MTDIILSIHPKWAELILEGKKTIEVRKTHFRDIRVGDKIYLYATAPVKKVVGQCCYDQHDHWLENQDEVMKTCLSCQEIYDYVDYPGGKLPVFIWITDPVRYTEPMGLSDFGLTRAPQSFCYVREASL